MEVILKRIKRTEFDDVMEKVITHFNRTQTIELLDEDLEKASENVIINGKQISFLYNIDEYNEIANSDRLNFEKLTLISMKLHKDSKDIAGTRIPTNIMYEKEIWAYLSFKVFVNIVKKLKLDDDDKITEDKIKRFYFNVGNSSGKRSRTGLLFWWSIIDMLGSEDEEEISRIAFHFIDPVRAIYERAMSRNPIILRAFVEAIIKNKCDARIKNKIYKTKVPKNISCFARVSIMDTYEYQELVDTMANQIQEVLQVA